MRSSWIIFIFFSCAVVQAQITPNNQFDRDLILYLPLNGNIQDESPLKNNCFSWNIKPEKDKNGNNNGAFSFDNIGFIGVQNIDNFNGLTAFTITSWIYLNKYTEHNTIISKVNPGRDFNLQVQEDGTLNFHTYKNGYIHFNSQHKIPLQEWVYVTFTYTGKVFQMYINGEPEKFSINFEGAFVPMDELKFSFSWTGKDLTVGNLYPYARESFYGRIDDLRVYKRVLSLSEIKKLINLKNNERGIAYPLGDFNNSEQNKQVIDNDSFKITTPGNQKGVIDAPVQEIKL
ncbi:LamG domain-containing protein [Flavobacterium panacagri]|uniref:LamG domain-containing protein n=1 Tax=Flavobacterium panacagri TaxID=3034146 RepID=UPI0025A5AF9B|nr:LamG domain-containing protein [Flavobacterium panacagri]